MTSFVESKMSPPVTIDYTNHRGERGMRRIVPINVYFSCNKWHPEEQWLLAAWDLDKNADRIFAMRTIHSWDNSVDISIARQLQNSMERNARMGNRLEKLRTEMLSASSSDRVQLRSRLCGAEEVIRQILNDEEPVWPGAT